MLAGVGPETAAALVKLYPTPAALFEAYTACAVAARATGGDVDAACVQLLTAVPVTLARKVGAKAARSIYSNLFPMT